jgi:hypothetical protein
VSPDQRQHASDAAARSLHQSYTSTSIYDLDRAMSSCLFLTVLSQRQSSSCAVGAVPELCRQDNNRHDHPEKERPKICPDPLEYRERRLILIATGKASLKAARQRDGQRRQVVPALVREHVAVPQHRNGNDESNRDQGHMNDFILVRTRAVASTPSIFTRPFFSTLARKFSARPIAYVTLSTSHLRRKQRSQFTTAAVAGLLMLLDYRLQPCMTLTCQPEI